MHWEVFRAWMREPQLQHRCVQLYLCSRAHYVCHCQRTPHQCHLPRDHSLAKTKSREKGTLFFSLLHRLRKPGYPSSWKLSSLVS